MPPRKPADHVVPRIYQGAPVNLNFRRESAIRPKYIIDLKLTDLDHVRVPTHAQNLDEGATIAETLDFESLAEEAGARPPNTENHVPPRRMRPRGHPTATKRHAHTFARYHIALHRNPGETALCLGHTNQQFLCSTYRDHVPKKTPKPTSTSAP